MDAIPIHWPRFEQPYSLAAIRTCIANGDATDLEGAQAIAQWMVDPDGEGQDNWGHFKHNAYRWLTAALLHRLNTTDDVTIVGIADLMAGDLRKVLSRMAQTEHDLDLRFGWMDDDGRPTQTHPHITRTAQLMAHKPDAEAASIISTAWVLGVEGIRNAVMQMVDKGDDDAIREAFDRLLGDADGQPFIGQDTSLMLDRAYQEVIAKDAARSAPDANILSAADAYDDGADGAGAMDAPAL